MDDTASINQFHSLQACLSPECWKQRVEQAHQRVTIVEAILRSDPNGTITRKGVLAAAPEVSWSNAFRWWTWYHTRNGEPWERMIDRRKPGKVWNNPESWNSVIRTFGRQQPQPSFDKIREALVGEFGSQAAVSDSTIRRILKKAGLCIPIARQGQPEQVTELSGGGGLVLLLAAIVESEGLKNMAEGVVKAIKAQSSSENVATEESLGRNIHGELTTVYNQNRIKIKNGGERCEVYRSVNDKRKV